MSVLADCGGTLYEDLSGTSRGDSDESSLPTTIESSQSQFSRYHNNEPRPGKPRRSPKGPEDSANSDNCQTSQVRNYHCNKT